MQETSDIPVKKKKKIGFYLAVVILLVGIGFLLYPVIGGWIYKYQSRSVIAEFDSKISLEREDQNEDWEWLYKLMVAYNEDLFENRQNGLTDPFSYEQIDFSLVEFGFDEEIIGHIDIPRLDMQLPVYLGASTEHLSKGAAHLTHTSLPVGGQNTNAVISAHRGYNEKEMLRNIERLELGDVVYLTNFKETLVYVVDEIKIISPTDINEVLIQEGRDLLTLLTCHPKNDNYERYVVYCERDSD